MLKIIRSMSDLQFGKLMEVYMESNLLNGSENYPTLPRAEQLIFAEQDFYQYLSQVFFKQVDSFYAVWDLGTHFGSALRIEPYRDGVLLCALETAPTMRHTGLASRLIDAVVAYLSMQGSGIIYSHVSKRNTASLSVHKKCGFQIIAEHAVYSDGSVLQNLRTLALKYEKSESSM